MSRFLIKIIKFSIIVLGLTISLRNSQNSTFHAFFKEQALSIIWNKFKFKLRLVYSNNESGIIHNSLSYYLKIFQKHQLNIKNYILNTNCDNFSLFLFQMHSKLYRGTKDIFWICYLIILFIHMSIKIISLLYGS